MDDFEVSLRKYQGMCMQVAALLVGGWVDNRNEAKIVQAAAMAHTIIRLGNSKEYLYTTSKSYAKLFGMPDNEIDEMIRALETNMYNIVVGIVADMERMDKIINKGGTNNGN